MASQDILYEVMAFEFTSKCKAEYSVAECSWMHMEKRKLNKDPPAIAHDKNKKYIFLLVDLAINCVLNKVVAKCLSYVAVNPQNCSVFNLLGVIRTNKTTGLCPTFTIPFEETFNGQNLDEDWIW